jgi:hypothetical protein
MSGKINDYDVGLKAALVDLGLQEDCEIAPTLNRLVQRYGDHVTGNGLSMLAYNIISHCYVITDAPSLLELGQIFDELIGKVGKGSNFTQIDRARLYAAFQEIYDTAKVQNAEFAVRIEETGAQKILSRMLRTIQTANKSIRQRVQFNALEDRLGKAFGFSDDLFVAIIEGIIINMAAKAGLEGFPAISHAIIKRIIKSNTPAIVDALVAYYGQLGENFLAQPFADYGRMIALEKFRPTQYELRNYHKVLNNAGNAMLANRRGLCAILGIIAELETKLDAGDFKVDAAENERLAVPLPPNMPSWLGLIKKTAPGGMN